MKPETIKIDEVEYVRKDAAIAALPVLEGDFQPFQIGGIYLIRTVTMIDLGRVVAASHRYIVLEDASWIADTGRFADALEKCQFDEVEPFPDGRVILNTGSVIDAVRVAQVQRSQK